MILTGASSQFPLDTGVSRDYINDLTDLQISSWLYYGFGANDSTSQTATLASASYSLSFVGTSVISTMTLFAHAYKADLNWSNNPTYVAKDSCPVPPTMTSSFSFHEANKLKIKNTISSSYLSPTASFENQTFITKIGIYDEQRNLIGIASVAEPVKKTENRDFTFKLKMDF